MSFTEFIIIIDIKVDYAIWKTIENKEFCCYFTFGSLTTKQKEEVNHLRNQVKKLINENYNIQTTNSLLRKTSSGYFFTNVCIFKSRTNCKTHFYTKTNIRTGKYHLSNNIKCNHD